MPRRAAKSALRKLGFDGLGVAGPSWGTEGQGQLRAAIRGQLRTFEIWLTDWPIGKNYQLTKQAQLFVLKTIFLSTNRVNWLTARLTETLDGVAPVVGFSVLHADAAVAARFRSLSHGEPWHS